MTEGAESAWIPSFCQCFYDKACTDPFDAAFNGGLGCNAGGRGQHCRFCGFTANNGSVRVKGIPTSAAASALLC